MGQQTQLQQCADGDQIRLCTANGLVYRAYRRRYPSGGTVLSLIASGLVRYPAPWELFFQGVAGDPNEYRLLEKAPVRFYFLTTFYSPVFCSQFGLEDVQDAITVTDAAGSHHIPVEDFGE